MTYLGLDIGDRRIGIAVSSGGILAGGLETYTRTSLKNDVLHIITLVKMYQADRIIVDPGVGFGKDYEMNLLTIRRLDLFRELGYPVLLGTSRKSVIGLTLDLPTSERVEGTLATTVMGVMSGCAFVRVHDIKENKRAIMMTEAILGK